MDRSTGSSSTKCSTLERDYRLSYVATKDGGEIDLLLSKPRDTVAIEIKSAERVDPVRVERFARLARAIPGARAYWLSRDPMPQAIARVSCLEWREGLREVFRVPATREA